jgi:hypothetical protein
MCQKAPLERNEVNTEKLGSKEIALLENISQRSANYMKDRVGFPPIEWIGRTWRVSREAYDTWKGIESARRSNKNA